MSGNPGSSGSSNPQDSKKQNWDPYLRHSSPLGILKPDIVFPVFSMASSQPSSSSTSEPQGAPSIPTSSSAAAAQSPPPPPWLIRTEHTPDGTSVITADGPLAPFQPYGPSSSAFSVADVRPTVPVNNTQQTSSHSSSLPQCPPAGVLFVITDMPPGQRAPMHRTLSLDYAVVLSGEIVLLLDGGEERLIRPGELIVQGGTNHSWENRGSEWCRILFVMVGAEQVVLEDGRVLEKTVFKGPSGS